MLLFRTERFPEGRNWLPVLLVEELARKVLDVDRLLTALT